MRICFVLAGSPLSIACKSRRRQLATGYTKLRKVLLTQDRVQSGLLPMTHDFLATMLGTDRSSVPAAASFLQKQKIVEYTRFSVKVLNRKALEESSCEYYSLIREHNAELAR
jgi:hypothetical protein